MIRLVLFDIDGTLIASGGAGVRAFAEVARTTFGKPDGIARLNFAGRTDLSIIREFFAAHDIPATPDRFARFLDDYVLQLQRNLAEVSGRVLPGVHEFLSALAAIPHPPVLGLLTGNIRQGAELKLRRYGLWDAFVTGAFSDDHEDRNVIAAIARDRGAERIGRPLAGDEVLVIGDTPHDITCARAIGARCLAVATGSSSVDALREHDPRWVVPGLAGLNAAEFCV